MVLNMNFSKKTICLVAVISLLILAVLPNFTLSAIESMSSERTSNGARTAEETTAPGFATIDDACKEYLGENYTSSYDPVSETTTYSVGIEGDYITYKNDAEFGVYTTGGRTYLFYVG